MSAGVGMRQTTLKYESDRFESTVGVRAKRQSTIVGLINLGPVVVQEKEGIQMWQTGAGQGAPSR